MNKISNTLQSIVWKSTLQSKVWERWELYSDAQKEVILADFRRRLPDDHFNKELLVEFLQEKYQQK